VNPIVIRESWNNGDVMVIPVAYAEPPLVTLYATERNPGHPGGVATACLRLTAAETHDLIEALIAAHADIRGDGS
jgi:hypothetical protein